MKKLDFKKEAIHNLEFAVLLFWMALVAIYLCSGCSEKWKTGKCRQWNVCQTTSDSTVITLHDTIYKVSVPYTQDADSAWIQMWLECNENNQIIETRYELFNGKYILLQHTLENGILNVNANKPVIHDTIEIGVPVTNSTTTHEIVKNSPPVHYLTGWEKFCYVLGLIFFGLIIIAIIYAVVWVVKKIMVKV